MLKRDQKKRFYIYGCESALSMLSCSCTMTTCADYSCLFCCESASYTACVSVTIFMPPPIL